ncbi:hypothetical protein LCGC14_2860570 [marine sediment metagenome]|uniref:Uncharacterized protein n=1 Tax=marine sediment metagenome TaxID=412755 RepID=A0A0F8Y604_9ZZZZ
MELFSFAEILTAVVIVLGGQKGFEFYRKKRYSNGRHDRRSSSNRNSSFSEGDRSFIQGCFENQTKEMGLEMRSDRLELMIGIKEIIQSEGEKTRSVVRSNG